MMMTYGSKNFGLGGLGDYDYPYIYPADTNPGGEYGGQATYPNDPIYGTGSGGSGNSIASDIANILGPLDSAAGKILTTRYAVPQLQPGQFVQGGGLTAYQLPTGATSSPFGGSFSTSGLTGMLPILGVGLVLLLMLKK